MNPILIGITRDTELNESKKLILVNTLTILCIFINTAYFLFLISIGEYFISLFNLACGSIFGFLGFYFMYTKRYKVAKVFNFITIPIVFVLFSLIYGDLGFNLYFVLFSIASFFILEHRKAILRINIWLFTIFILINIGIAKKFIVPYDTEIAYWGSIFYWVNLTCGFVFTLVVLFVFKAENLRYEMSLKQKNIQILQQNQEISMQRDLLDRENKTKNRFFSIIAHDLKNPFIGMIYGSELLIDAIKNNPENKEELIQNIENIHLSTRNGFKLLENLLEWARTQTDEIKCNPCEIYINEVIKECITSMQSFIESKNIKISFDNKPNKVFVDRNMLCTIVRNLLSNAIKYTQANGSVDIAINDNGNAIEVKVSDTGVGMSEEFVSSLFCIEYINPTLGTHNEKGTGLGLLLCKDFVKKNGGDIWVTSELGKGSSFYFTLPTIQN